MRITKSILLIVMIFAGCSENPDSDKLFTNTKSGVNVSFRGISVVNKDVIWVSGSGGTVLRTIDSGIIWNKLNLPEEVNGLDFRDVEAFDANTAVIISAGRPAKILKTTDGGLNWVEQFSSNQEGIFFDSIDFWDLDHGAVYSDPINGKFVIIRTENGGEDWERVNADNLPDASEGEAGFAASGTMLSVGKDGYGYIGTGGNSARLLVTADYGITWDVFDTPIQQGESSQGIFSVAFYNNNLGVIAGGDYANDQVRTATVCVTTDGGKTWKIPKDDSLPFGFKSVVKYIPDTDGNELIAVGTSGIDYSLDSGMTWFQADTTGFHTFDFSEKDRSGWAAGSNGRIAKFNKDLSEYFHRQKK